MKIRALTILEAWELFKLIKDHFPEKLDTEVVVVDFISTFVDSVAKKDPEIILQIISLLLEDKDVKIESMSSSDIFVLLVDGFHQNKVFDLYNFFREVIL